MSNFQSIKERLELHTAKRDEEMNNQTPTKLSKKEKKKQKESKKLAKLKKVDADKVRIPLPPCSYLKELIVFCFRMLMRANKMRRKSKRRKNERNFCSRAINRLPSPAIKLQAFEPPQRATCDNLKPISILDVNAIHHFQLDEDCVRCQFTPSIGLPNSFKPSEGGYCQPASIKPL